MLSQQDRQEPDSSLMGGNLVGLFPRHGVTVDKANEGLQGVVAALEYHPASKLLPVDQHQVTDEGVHPGLSCIPHAREIQLDPGSPSRIRASTERRSSKAWRASAKNSPLSGEAGEGEVWG